MVGQLVELVIEALKIVVVQPVVRIADRFDERKQAGGDHQGENVHGDQQRGADREEDDQELGNDRYAVVAGRTVCLVVVVRIVQSVHFIIVIVKTELHIGNLERGVG